MSKKILRITVPLCMLLGVGTLWYLNAPQEPAPSAHTPLAAEQNPDFALHASSINMEELKKLNVPIIIDFGADSCVPCKKMAPVLVKLNAQMQNKAIIKFVDVWKNPDGAKGFPVQVIPTQLIFHADGTPYTPKNVKDIPFISYGSKSTNEHAFTAHQGGLTEAQLLAILKDMGVQ